MREREGWTGDEIKDGREQKLEMCLGSIGKMGMGRWREGEKQKRSRGAEKEAGESPGRGRRT